MTLENGDSAGADIPGCNGVAPSGSGSGDAILIDGSGDSSIMKSCVRNSIIWGRGAISHENTSTLSIKNTSFMDNESTVSGGAVHYDGCGDITITRSRFGGNIARSPSEAIYSRHLGDKDTPLIDIRSNTLSVNEAFAFGGAIATAGLTLLRARGSALSDNTVLFSDGARSTLPAASW